MKIIKGDLLSVKEGIICHGVNCCGVMNLGIAKQIRQKWPKVYERYLEKYQIEGWDLSDVQFVKVASKLIIANCATQYKPGPDARAFNIQECLIRCQEVAIKLKTQVNMPLIGCGIGGLDWESTVKVVVDLVESEQVFYYGCPEINVYVL